MTWIEYWSFGLTRSHCQFIGDNPEGLIYTSAHVQCIEMIERYLPYNCTYFPFHFVTNAAPPYYSLYLEDAFKEDPCCEFGSKSHGSLGHIIPSACSTPLLKYCLTCSHTHIFEFKALLWCP